MPSLKLRRIHERTALLILASTVAAGGFMAACARDEAAVASGIEEAGNDQPLNATTTEGGDWLALDEQTLLPVLDDLAASLQAAHYALDRKDPTSAAAEIGRAADILETEIEGATPDQKDRILTAAAELRDVAEEIAAGEGIDEVQLTRAFQEAYEADTQERWVLLEEDLLLPRAVAPENHLRAAEQALSEEDGASAALEIRKAVAFMLLETNRADDEALAPLQAAEKELSRLADGMDRGNLEETGAFERAAATATLALGEYHLARAASAWKDDQTETAAHGLENASAYLRRAAVWSELEPDAVSESALAEADRLAETLYDDGEWQGRDMVSVLESVQATADHFREQVHSWAVLRGEIGKPG